MAYTWRFYLLVAHLTDENKHTACNRQLPQTDEAICVPEGRKCKTCLHSISKQEGKE